MSNREVKIGFAAPLNKSEWKDDIQKQFNILQLSCLLSYDDMGRDVVQRAAEYIEYINIGDCDDTHVSDKTEAFYKLVDAIRALVTYGYYPKNLARIVIDVIDTITSTLVSNIDAGNEYYIGRIVNCFYENFKQKLIQYGKDLNVTLDNIVNEVYNIPFEVYPKDKYYRRKDHKLAFDLVDERIIELYDKTLKDTDEVHDTYVTKVFSIFSSKFRMNITVNDSSKSQHKSVNTLLSQPVILELDEIKFNEVELDEVVMSALLTTMFTKSEKDLKKLVKDTLIQVETCNLNDDTNIQSAKNFIIKNFLRIDSDKEMRSILYNSLNRRFSTNYNLSRLEVQDAMEIDFPSVLYKLCDIILSRYEQLEPVCSTYYRILSDCGEDSLKLRTTQPGGQDHLYIQYCDKEKDRNYRIMRITIKSRVV